MSKGRYAHIQSLLLEIKAMPASGHSAYNSHSGKHSSAVCLFTQRPYRK